MGDVIYYKRLIFRPFSITCNDASGFLKPQIYCLRSLIVENQTKLEWVFSPTVLQLYSAVSLQLHGL